MPVFAPRPASLARAVSRRPENGLVKKLPRHQFHQFLLEGFPTGSAPHRRLDGCQHRPHRAHPALVERCWHSYRCGRSPFDRLRVSAVGVAAPNARRPAPHRIDFAAEPARCAPCLRALARRQPSETVGGGIAPLISSLDGERVFTGRRACRVFPPPEVSSGIDPYPIGQSGSRRSSASMGAFSTRAGGWSARV